MNSLFGACLILDGALRLVEYHPSGEFWAESSTSAEFEFSDCLSGGGVVPSRLVLSWLSGGLLGWGYRAQTFQKMSEFYHQRHVGQDFLGETFDKISSLHRLFEIVCVALAESWATPDYFFVANQGHRNLELNLLVFEWDSICLTCFEKC